MSYPGLASGSTRNIDMSRSQPSPLLARGLADVARRTESDLAINIRKATSIGGSWSNDS